MIMDKVYSVRTQRRILRTEICDFCQQFTHVVVSCLCGSREREITDDQIKRVWNEMKRVRRDKRNRPNGKFFMVRFKFLRRLTCSARKKEESEFVREFFVCCSLVRRTESLPIDSMSPCYNSDFLGLFN